MVSDSRTGDGDIFEVHGPKDITKIDWGNEEHRRRIAASLVRGIVVLEKDRKEGRKEEAARAPAWWKSFHFDLEKLLTEKDLLSGIRMGGDKQSIFGAIFKFNPDHDLSPGRRLSVPPPRYVVAFRGTMLSHPTVAIKDVYHDGHIMTNTLKPRARSQMACGVVKELIKEKEIRPSSDGCVDVWLAGHSLGASMALLVGRDMMEQDKPLSLPTFLFNPPQVSLQAAINLLDLKEKRRMRMHRVDSFLKLVAGRAFSSHRERMEDLFRKLSPWVPNLYVHERDEICRGFIDYFERREQFVKRFPYVGIWWMTLSYRDMISQRLHGDTVQPHLLPSAKLWKCSRVDRDKHGLREWWKTDGELSLGAGTRYSYPPGRRA